MAATREAIQYFCQVRLFRGNAIPGDMDSFHMRRIAASGVPRGGVLAETGYGNETWFREGITELGTL